MIIAEMYLTLISELEKENKVGVDKAKQIYILLVEYGGAREGISELYSFILWFLDTESSQYRFQGIFGFGGKYFKQTNVVSYYKENWTDELDEKMNILNKKLKNVV